MALIIVGMIVLIIGIVIARNPGAAQRYAGIVKISGIVIMVIGVLVGSIVQIDAGQVGVKKLFGKVQNDVLQSGLHMINPLIEVTSDLTVLFRLTEADAPRLLKETGENYVDKIVRPITRTKIRDNSVYYDAISLTLQNGMNFKIGSLKV